MYLFTPDEIDRKRANRQAENQGVGDVDCKRRGNLGELAFEQFCREYLPIELWEWKNDEAIRTCEPECFSSFDFEVFGYEVDVKTSRDVSAFRPAKVLDNDADDDIVVMVWHRDKEDGLILLGWERVETLQSKAASQESYSGAEPAKLDHLAARPMNEFLDLGPNTAHMNQKPQNPFAPGDRVVKSSETHPDVGIVIEVLPPEAEPSVYGHLLEGEAINVAFPVDLNAAPNDWRELHPALLAAHCAEHGIKRYTYKHTNLEKAETRLIPGDRVVKTSHDDPDTAVIVGVGNGTDDESVTVVYETQLDGVDDIQNLPENANRYTYTPEELDRVVAD